jgi:hypothetical protein
MNFKNKLTTAAVLGMMALSVQGCGDDDSAFAGSCAVDSIDQCTEYPSSTASNVVTAAKAACGVLSGTWTDSAACSTTDSVGKCTATVDSVTSTTVYYSPTYTQSELQTLCEGSGGTFTAP